MPLSKGDLIFFNPALFHAGGENRSADVQRFVNVEPANKHDLFLIPNGTIHCAGVDVMVLEISATPYIFTFKLYDWLRLDLDGKPRPINIERGFANLNFDRKAESVKRELISQPAVIASGTGWQILHLPTHAEHPYDVHRLEFDKEITVNTDGSVQVLSLVEGSQMEVHTGNRTIKIHYAETFVIPAAARQYTLVNTGPERAKVVKAFIKPEKT